MSGRVYVVFVAMLFAVLVPTFAQTESSEAATAAINCNQQKIAIAKRSLTSVHRTILQNRCKQAHKALTTVRFFQTHRELTAPKYAKCWDVPNVQLRYKACKSRSIVRKSQKTLRWLAGEIKRLRLEAFKNYDGYVALSDARELGQLMAEEWGWTQQNGQWQCLDSLWANHESSWNMHADNPTSTAYGIPQALPGSKMGPRWSTSAWTQIKWGLGYVRGRYGSPCGALRDRLSKGWY